MFIRIMCHVINHSENLKVYTMGYLVHSMLLYVLELRRYSDCPDIVRHIT